MRVIPNEWLVIRKFYESIHGHSKYNQAKLIFWKLLMDDAYSFVCSAKSYGLDSDCEPLDDNEVDGFVRKHTSFGNIMRTEVDIMSDNSTGILVALDAIQCGYNEMKEVLDNSPGPSTHKCLPQSKIMETLQVNLTKIENRFQATSNIENLSEENEELNSTVKSELNNDDPTTCKRRKIKERLMTKSSKAPNPKPTCQNGSSVVLHREPRVRTYRNRKSYRDTESLVEKIFQTDVDLDELLESADVEEETENKLSLDVINLME